MLRKILVDGNNVAHAAYHTSKGLRDARGRPTGMSSTFLQTLLVSRRIFDEPVDYVVAWDSQNSWRKSVFPDYKANRTWSNDKDLEYAFEILKEEVLPALGVHQVWAVREDGMGLEADDIAALYFYTDECTMFVSSDKDWLQLHKEDQTKIYRTVQKRLVTTDEEFEDETGYPTPYLMRACRAITGEKGDNIPGLDGVGVKTALKYMRGESISQTASQRIQAWLNDPEGYNRSYQLFSLEPKCIPTEPTYRAVQAARDHGQAVRALESISAASMVRNNFVSMMWS